MKKISTMVWAVVGVLACWVARDGAADAALDTSVVGAASPKSSSFQPLLLLSASGRQAVVEGGAASHIGGSSLPGSHTEVFPPLASHPWEDRQRRELDKNSDSAVARQMDGEQTLAMVQSFMSSMAARPPAQRPAYIVIRSPDPAVIQHVVTGLTQRYSSSVASQDQSIMNNLVGGVPRVNDLTTRSPQSDTQASPDHMPVFPFQSRWESPASSSNSPQDAQTNFIRQQLATLAHVTVSSGRLVNDTLPRHDTPRPSPLPAHHLQPTPEAPAISQTSSNTSSAQDSIPGDLTQNKPTSPSDLQAEAEIDQHMTMDYSLTSSSPDVLVGSVLPPGSKSSGVAHQSLRNWSKIDMKPGETFFSRDPSENAIISEVVPRTTVADLHDSTTTPVTTSTTTITTPATTSTTAMPAINITTISTATATNTTTVPFTAETMISASDTSHEEQSRIDGIVSDVFDLDSNEIPRDMPMMEVDTSIRYEDYYEEIDGELVLSPTKFMRKGGPMLYSNNEESAVAINDPSAPQESYKVRNVSDPTSTFHESCCSEAEEDDVSKSQSASRRGSEEEEMAHTGNVVTSLDGGSVLNLQFLPRDAFPYLATMSPRDLDTLGLMEATANSRWASNKTTVREEISGNSSLITTGDSRPGTVQLNESNYRQSDVSLQQQLPSNFFPPRPTPAPPRPQPPKPQLTSEQQEIISRLPSGMQHVVSAIVEAVQATPHPSAAPNVPVTSATFSHALPHPHPYLPNPQYPPYPYYHPHQYQYLLPSPHDHSNTAQAHTVQGILASSHTPGIHAPHGNHIPHGAHETHSSQYSMNNPTEGSVGPETHTHQDSHDNIETSPHSSSDVTDESNHSATEGTIERPEAPSSSSRTPKPVMAIPGAQVGPDDLSKEDVSALDLEGASSASQLILSPSVAASRLGVAASSSPIMRVSSHQHGSSGRPAALHSIKNQGLLQLRQDPPQMGHTQASGGGIVNYRPPQHSNMHMRPPVLNVMLPEAVGTPPAAVQESIAPVLQRTEASNGDDDSSSDSQSMDREEVNSLLQSLFSSPTLLLLGVVFAASAAYLAIAMEEQAAQQRFQQAQLAAAFGGQPFPAGRRRREASLGGAARRTVWAS